MCLSLSVCSAKRIPTMSTPGSSSSFSFAAPQSLKCQHDIH